MLISRILLLHMCYTTIAINDIGCPGCLTIDTFPYTGPCNGSFKFYHILQDKDKNYDFNYEIAKDDSSDWNIYNYYICEFGNDGIEKCISNVPGCLLDSVECMNHANHSHTNKTGNIFQTHKSSHTYIHFVVAKNSESVLKSCILYFPYREETNATLQDIKANLPSNPLNADSNPNLPIIVISILCVAICCVIVVCCKICFCHIRRLNCPDNETVLTGSLDIKKAKDDSKLLFIYDSNSQSFKEIVFLVQNVIESTTKCKVINPYMELDSIANYNPNQWLQSHTNVENTKYVLFLNQQLLKYMQNTNIDTISHDDPLTRLLKFFFSGFLFHLSDDQVINISMEIFTTTHLNLKGSTLHILPHHFKELVKGFGMPMDDETIIIQEKNLKSSCDRYLAEQAERIE